MKYCILAAILSAWGTRLEAASTIDTNNRYAYGANVGWMDWLSETNNGALISRYVCSGYIYSGGIGWINLGGGTPANSIRYQNNSATDFGVNVDETGNLTGFAWAGNIGWINFENTGAPKVNLLDGKFSGYAWSANAGWISLSNLTAFVQTDKILPGQLDSNGLPTAWELTYFGHTAVNPNADADGDGVSNYNEYLAGTNPTNAMDFLRITSTTFAPGGTNTTLTWNSTPSRLYSIQKALSLTNIWADSGLGLISPSVGQTTIATFNDSNAPIRFYRIQAVSPLAP